MTGKKIRYPLEQWGASGRGDWVFTVAHPSGLVGAHARLIDRALRDAERVDYCIYAPRVTATRTPFGLEAEESSCGVCVTDHRFIISRNLHREGSPPTVSSIDFNDILWCHLGSAMLLSWLSLVYIQEGGVQRRTILFGSNGKHHFEKALRVYKKQCRSFGISDDTVCPSSPGRFLHSVSNKVHRNYLKTLITSNEMCMLSFPAHYIWGFTNAKRFMRGREPQAYTASKATVLLTTKALLLARDAAEETIRIRVDVLNISLDKIRSVDVEYVSHGECRAEKIHILFNREAKDAHMDILLLCSDDAVMQCVNTIRQLRAEN